MAPGMGFEEEAGKPKKAGATPFYYGGPSSPFVSKATSSGPVAEWWPNINVSPFSSTTSPSSPAAIPGHNHNFKAPDRKQNDLQASLLEATKRAAVAERKAAEYLQAKENAERQLQDHSAEAALTTANQQLTAENQKLKEDFKKLEKHTKNCEKATNKAQKEVQHAKGYANHVINSQKGNLQSVERRYEAAARELKEWREKYGSVEKPAEEKAALRKRLSEWQSKAEKARNEIATLKRGSQGEQRGAAAEGNHQSSTEVAGNESSITAEENQSSTSITAAEEDPRNIQAEAKAAKYKGERDTLYRMLQQEVARNAKLAESLVLRNAKLAESLEGWVIDDDGAS